MFPHPEYVLTPFGWGKIIGDPYSTSSRLLVEMDGSRCGVKVDYLDIVRYDNMFNCAAYFNMGINPHYPDGPRTYCKFDYGWIPRWSAVHPTEGSEAVGTRYDLGFFTRNWGAWPARPFGSSYILLRVGVNRELAGATQSPIELPDGQSMETWLTEYRGRFTSAEVGLELHAVLEQITPERKIVWWDFLLHNGWCR